MDHHLATFPYHPLCLYPPPSQQIRICTNCTIRTRETTRRSVCSKCSNAATRLYTCICTVRDIGRIYCTVRNHSYAISLPTSNSHTNIASTFIKSLYIHTVVQTRQNTTAKNTKKKRRIKVCRFLKNDTPKLAQFL